MSDTENVSSMSTEECAVDTEYLADDEVMSYFWFKLTVYELPTFLS